MNRQWGATLPESFIRVYRQIRELSYVFLEPLDYIVRVINGKGDFPPLYLRKYIGTLRGFEASGSEFRVYLRLFCGLQPYERILDIGCGCGLIALYLRDDFGLQVDYVGVDIHRPSIRWCQKHISRDNEQYMFRHIDVENHLYNPTGKYAAENYAFPFEDHSFDVILLKSVLTHMLPAEVERYFQEIARLLSTQGRCLATLFLLNETQKALEQHGKNQLQFKFGDQMWRYIYKNDPEAAVAYSECCVMSMLQKYGLELAEPVIYGTWSGREDGVSYQDLLLIRRQVEG
jgi:SAM-dependent methyltransferase